jgi:rRNA processing protein Gar1
MWNAITDQGIFGIVCAVLGVVAGVYLSRMFRRKRAETEQRKRAMTPKVYSSRQEMRKAEREQRKKEGR